MQITYLHWIVQRLCRNLSSLELTFIQIPGTKFLGLKTNPNNKVLRTLRMDVICNLPTVDFSFTLFNISWFLESIQLLPSLWSMKLSAVKPLNHIRIHTIFLYQILSKIILTSPRVKMKIDIVSRENKILTRGLNEKNSVIMYVESSLEIQMWPNSPFPPYPPMHIRITPSNYFTIEGGRKLGLKIQWNQ